MLDFPNNPTEGQDWTDPSGLNWRYIDGSWVALNDQFDYNYIDGSGNSFNDLDLNLTNLQDGDILVWDGSKFTNQQPSLTARDEYAFRVYNSAQWGYGVDEDPGTWETIALDTIALERTNGGSSNYNTGTYTYTVPLTGYWFFGFLGHLYATTQSILWRVRFVFTGSRTSNDIIIWTETDYPKRRGTGNGQIHKWMEAGDTVSVQAYFNTTYTKYFPANQADFYGFYISK